MKPLHLLGPADEPLADEDARDGQPPAAGHRLELPDEGRVHGEVPLVDRDAEPAEDRPDGPAVLERLADHAEACEVDDHRGGRRRRRRWGGVAEVEVAAKGGDAVEDVGATGGIGWGLRLWSLAAELLYVLE